MSDAAQRDHRNGGSSETKGAPTQHGFMALASGTRFARGYTIQSVIAAGGFGITYLGTHDALQRTCAIKEHFPRQFAYRDSASSDVRPTDPATYSWALDRFIQEGRSLAKCSHPNVVSVGEAWPFPSSPDKSSTGSHSDARRKRHECYKTSSVTNGRSEVVCSVRYHGSNPDDGHRNNRDDSCRGDGRYNKYHGDNRRVLHPHNSSHFHGSVGGKALYHHHGYDDAPTLLVPLRNGDGSHELFRRWS